MILSLELCDVQIPGKSPIDYRKVNHFFGTTCVLQHDLTITVVFLHRGLVHYGCVVYNIYGPTQPGLEPCHEKAMLAVSQKRPLALVSH